MPSLTLTTTTNQITISPGERLYRRLHSNLRLKKKGYSFKIIKEESFTTVLANVNKGN